MHRGDWLVEPALHAPTLRIEAWLRLFGDWPAPLCHDAPVHLHLGSADLGARVLMPRQRAVQPGEDAMVQLVLDAPTSAVTGQRFVLRDQAGRSLLGGGQVLDPLANQKRQSLALRQAKAAALALPSPAEALAALAAIPGLEPDTGWFARCCGLTTEALTTLLAEGDLVLVGNSAIARTRFARHGDALAAAISQHHIANPESGGMTRREARLALGEPISPDLFAALLRALAEAGRIASVSGMLRLPGHVPSFSDAENAIWQALLERCEEASLAQFWPQIWRASFIAATPRSAPCYRAAGPAAMSGR